MSTKNTQQKRSLKFNLNNLNSMDIFSVDSIEHTCYNEYVAAQIKELPELMLAVLQYDGGKDAMFYMQLGWMSDFWEQSRHQPS